MSLSEILIRLKFVPSFLTMDIINNYKLKTIQAKMNDPEEYECIEFVNDNLGSFLSFYSHDFSGCKSKFKKTLKSKPKNIQANVMKCVLYYKNGYFEKAEEVFKTLETLTKDEHLMAEAESELAYAYSRMGPKYYQRAIDLYEKVTSQYPFEYGWKYRFALTLRRLLRPDSRVSSEHTVDLKANFSKSKTLFEEVNTRAEQPELKALSQTALAVLIYDDIYDRFFEDLSKDERKEISSELLRHAMDLAPGNVKILSDAGRMLRRMKHNDEAIQVLGKAAAIRETTVNCHHLGLAYKDHPDLAIGYLRKSVDLSLGLNNYAVISLGLSYFYSYPPRYMEALYWFEELCMGDFTYGCKRDAAERASNCYRQLFLGEQNKKHEIMMYTFRQKCIVYAALECLQQPTHLQEKIPVKILFSKAHYSKMQDKYDCYNQYKRVINYFGKFINICQDITSMLRGLNNDQALTHLIHGYFRGERFDDCLDLTTILLVTTVKDIKKTAVDVMMRIVDKTGNDRNNLELIKTCFTRAVVGLCPMEEGSIHVRIICDISTCKEELDLIEEWLTGVDLKVAKNDEDIPMYMERQPALISSMSSNLAIICLFKQNNTGFMDEYPIDDLPAFRPAVIPLTIDDSGVAPKVAHFEPMVSDLKSLGTWLSEFGRKTFSSVIRSSE